VGSSEKKPQTADVRDQRFEEFSTLRKEALIEEGVRGIIRTGKIKNARGMRGTPEISGVRRRKKDDKGTFRSKPRQSLKLIRMLYFPKSPCETN